VDDVAKNFKNFASCCLQSPLQGDFTPSYGFLGLEISTATADKGGGGLALFGFVFILFFCLPLKVALFFLLLHFLIYKTSFPHRNNN
jgi:hypothetical protein